MAKPIKSSSGLSSILESSNVDPAAAAATVLVGGGAAAFLTSLLGSFLPSFDSSKEIERSDDQESQLIDRITTYTKQNSFLSRRTTSTLRPKRRRKPQRPNPKRRQSPSRHRPVPKRKPLPPNQRGVQNKYQRHQQTTSAIHKNIVNENDVDKMSTTSHIPSIPVRVLPVANVQTGYAQVIKQQQNDNENVDNLSNRPLTQKVNKYDEIDDSYDSHSQNHYPTNEYKLPNGFQEESYKLNHANTQNNDVKGVSRQIIDMFCREAVELSEEKLRNEFMTVDSFSFRLLKIIQKYEIPFPKEFLRTISERTANENQDEALDKQEMIVLILDKTCRETSNDANFVNQDTNQGEKSSSNQILYLGQDKKEQYVVSSVYTENPTQQVHIPKFDSPSKQAVDMPFLSTKEENTDTNKKLNEPVLEIITAHPNMQHLGDDFNSILAADKNSPASAVVVTSGFSFDKNGRPKAPELKPILPKEALRPGSVLDANDYKHLEKLPRHSDVPAENDYKNVVQLLTSSLKSRSGNIVSDGSMEEDYRDVRSPTPQRVTHLKDILDANLKRNLRQGAQYRQTFDQRQAPRQSSNIVRKFGHIPRQRGDGIQNLGRLNLPPRRLQQRRQATPSSRHSNNGQRYYGQHYHHQQLGLPWPNRTEPVSTFTLHHQTSSTRPIPKRPNILDGIDITLSTVYPTTTPGRLYTQFNSLDAVNIPTEEPIHRPTEATILASYDLIYDDSTEESENSEDLSLRHETHLDWNRPKRGNEIVPVSDNADPSSVEYVYNVTFTGTDDKDSTNPEEFDTDLTTLEIEENDDFNDSYVDELISDYYFPIIDLTSTEDNSDEPEEKPKKDTNLSYDKELQNALRKIGETKTRPRVVDSKIPNHRQGRPSATDLLKDRNFRLPQPGFRFEPKTDRTKIRQRQKISTNTRVTSIVTSKSTTYSVINKSTNRILASTRKPLVHVGRSPLTSTANTRKQNLSFRKSILRARAPFQEKTNHRRTQRTNSSHDEEAGRGRLALTLSLSAPASAASGARLLVMMMMTMIMIIMMMVMVMMMMAMMVVMMMMTGARG